MLLIFTRTIILYIAVLIVIRLMGKREIGQLQPFELIIVILFADLAAVPMENIGIPLMNGIISILGLLIMHLIISLINLKSIKAREIICGKPRILIHKGYIDEKALKKERITINELQERLRGNNIFDIRNVEYAILETSGQLTVLKKIDKDAKKEYLGLYYDLITDGKIMYENLKKLNKDEKWLINELSKINANAKEILIFIMNEKEEIFFQKKY